MATKLSQCCNIHFKKNALKDYNFSTQKTDIAKELFPMMLQNKKNCMDMCHQNILKIWARRKDYQ